MKYLVVLFSILCSFQAKSQYAGVNTVSPKTTFDIVGAPENAARADGLKAPLITLAQLNVKTAYGNDQTGALIYVTEITGGSTVDSTSLITGPGYYYFDGTVWQPIPKSGSAIFTASLGTGDGDASNATIAGQAFVTVPLSNVTKNIGGGVWNTANRTYEIPVSGTYVIKSSIRLRDGSVSRNVFQAVGTNNADIPEGLWQTSSGTRWTMLYTRISYFNKGDLLRLYMYSDNATAAVLSDASLDVVFISQN